MDDLIAKITAILEAEDCGTRNVDHLVDAIMALPEIHHALFCDCGAERTLGTCTEHCDNYE